MNYAYIRVSTDEQSIDAQKNAVLQYGRAKDIEGITFYEDTVSGFKVSWKKRKLAPLIDTLQENDIIIFPEISRISRKMVEVLNVLEILSERKVIVHVIKPEFIIDDSISSKILTFMLGLASEIERSFISQRTKEGINAARTKGKILGRKDRPNKSLRLDKYADTILKNLKIGLPKTSIITLLKEEGITTNPTSLYNWLRHYSIPVNFSEVQIADDVTGKERQAAQKDLYKKIITDKIKEFKAKGKAKGKPIANSHHDFQAIQ